MPDLDVEIVACEYKRKEVANVIAHGEASNAQYAKQEAVSRRAYFKTEKAYAILRGHKISALIWIAEERDRVAVALRATPFLIVQGNDRS